MAAKTIPIDKFLGLSHQYQIFDVRSPSEFSHAHIPKAFSLPLFNDEERRMVGTTYKQKSREKAIKAGLDFFGPKMKEMVEVVEKQLSNSGQKTLLLHCWRGGMRSAAVAWLLDLYGFEVYLLKGGYKSFRNWALKQFSNTYNLRILSGCTGCGKTEILHNLTKKGEATLDLEGLAGHRGSAFGDLGLPPQHGTEQFENKMALKLSSITQEFGNKIIWVESESSRIGNVNINHIFFEQMRRAQHVRINVPMKDRLKRIVNEYGGFKVEDLSAAVGRIQKRLGGLETKNTLEFLRNGDIDKAFEILMNYYDKPYKKSNLFQPPLLEIDLPDGNAENNAKIILEKLKEKYA